MNADVPATPLVHARTYQNAMCSRNLTCADAFLAVTVCTCKAEHEREGFKHLLRARTTSHLCVSISLRTAHSGGGTFAHISGRRRRLTLTQHTRDQRPSSRTTAKAVSKRERVGRDTQDTSTHATHTNTHTLLTMNSIKIRLLLEQSNRHSSWYLIQH